VKRTIVKIDEDKCDGCGICIPTCAEGALQLVDGKARLTKESYCDGLGACLGECPRDAISLEEREAEAFNEGEVKAQITAPSLLLHWPVKLRLVSPRAPYFRRDELVVAADCGPFAYGNFHQDFLDERVVVTGCPKFDDLEFYQEKLTEILRDSAIQKIIVARMEVPCCSGWLTVARNAVASSGKDISIEERVIGIRGEIIDSGGKEAHGQ
jgi:Pyruvate/2-oxoacid:ferredoxin oxidoreductase delta subunit